MSAEQPDALSLYTLTQRLEEVSNRPASLGDLLALFQMHGFGALLFVLGLIIFLPTGMVPGLSAICSLLILLLAGEMLVGRRAIWLPRRLQQQQISKALMQRMVAHLQRWQRWSEVIATQRWDGLFHLHIRRMAALLCAFYALITLLFGMVPGLGSVTAIPLMLFGLALSLRDGALMAAGFVLSAAGFCAAGAALFYSGALS